jgi:histidinol-phosphatase (PHP family)
VAAAARSGLFDILAHPDLVKRWGSGRPTPSGDLGRYYEPALEAIAETQIAVEVSTAGLRKPVAEIYPAPAFLAGAVETGAPVALSSDAHLPEHVGFGYDRALELLEAAGVRELAVFEARTRRLEPIGP